MLNTEKNLGIISQGVDFVVPFLILIIVSKIFPPDFLSNFLFHLAVFAIINIINEFGTQNYFIKTYSNADALRMINAFWELFICKIGIVALTTLLIVLSADFTEIGKSEFALFYLAPIIFALDTKIYNLISGNYKYYCKVSIFTKCIYLIILVALSFIFSEPMYFLIMIILHPIIINIVTMPKIRVTVNLKMIRHLKLSRLFFIQKISQNTYLNLPTIVANYLIGITPTEVAIPQRIVNALNTMATPVLMINFRDMSKNFQKETLKKFIYVFMVLYVFISLSIFFSAHTLLHFLFPVIVTEQMIMILKVVVLFVPIMIINSVIGNSILVSNGYVKVVMITSIIAVTFSILALIFASKIAINAFSLILILLAAPRTLECIMRMIVITHKGLMK